jgi:hypothetical protein
MLTLLLSLRDCFRARAFLQAEILALRHQLLVLQRSSRGHRLRLRLSDRVLWVWLSRIWNDWRSALLLVKPETVIAWHRKGFGLYWRWKSQCCEGRPTVSSEVRHLIQLSLPKMLSGANAFEINDIQEAETEGALPDDHDVTMLHCVDPTPNKLFGMHRARASRKPRNI